MLYRPFPDGTPVYEQHVVEGNEILLGRCTTLTERDGKYGCSNLPAGSYLVAAVVAGKTNQRPALFFAPGTTTLSSAEPVKVAVGSTAWADLRIGPMVGVAVQGRLEPSAAEAAFSLLASDADGASVDTQKQIAYDGKSGTFRIENVLPGRYLLRASWVVEGAEHLSTMAIDVGSLPLSKLRLVAIPNVVITGSFAPGSTTMPRTVSLRRTDGLIPVLTTDVQDGTFLFQVVPAGEYSLSLPGANTYINGISVGAKDFARETFSTVTTPMSNLQVRLGEPALSLHGIVEEWQSGGTKADIVAVSEQTGTVLHVTTDSQRRFSIGGLAPGEYRVYAWPESNKAPYRMTSYLAQNKEKSQEVSLSTSSAANNYTLSAIE